MSWREEPGALIFVNAAQVVTCAGAPRARRGGEMREMAVLTDAAVVIQGETIAAVGPARDLRPQYADATEVDCERRVLLPGLVDSHTHAVFGRARFERLVRDNQTLPASRLISLLKSEVAGYFRGSHPDDDVTILILERKLG